MKNSKNINVETFKGAGYVIGAIIGFAVAITAFIITENIAISIPLLVGLTIPLGMAIEQKIQVQSREKDTRRSKLLFKHFAVGILFLVTIVLITKFI